jgi:hypothetical protein
MAERGVPCRESLDRVMEWDGILHVPIPTFPTFWAWRGVTNHYLGTPAPLGRQVPR